MYIFFFLYYKMRYTSIKYYSDISFIYRRNINYAQPSLMLSLHIYHESRYNNVDNDES